MRLRIKIIFGNLIICTFPNTKWWIQNGGQKVWKSENCHCALSHMVFKDAEPDSEISFDKFKMMDPRRRTK